MNIEKQFGHYAFVLTLPTIHYGISTKHSSKDVYGVFLSSHLVFRRDAKWWRYWAVGFAIIGFGFGLEKRKEKKKNPERN